MAPKKVRGPRRVRVCPKEGCGIRTQQLPRHLMNIHRMDNEKANALSTALFHQDGQGRGRNDGDDVDKVRCFFPHCNAKVVNLHRHIVGVHGKSKKITSRMIRDKKYGIEIPNGMFDEVKDQDVEVVVEMERGEEKAKEQEDEMESSVEVSKQPRVGEEEMEEEEEDDMEEEDDDMEEEEDEEMEEEEDEEIEEEEESDRDYTPDTYRANEKARTMLHHYKVHLMSRLGKFKSEGNASQHVAQVQRVIASSLCNGSLDGLLNVEEASSMWVAEQKRQKKAEGTVASYCHSVAGFFDFLATGKLKHAFSDVLGIPTLQQKAKDWRKIAASLAKEGKVRQVELTERGYHDQLTNKEAQSLSAALEGSYLNKFRPLFVSQVRITASLAQAIRGYFLLRMALDNGARPSEFINMEVEWALKAIYEEQTNQYVIKVLTHKTVMKYGAARVCLNKELYDRFSIYIRHIRPRCPGYEQGTKHVFFTTRSPQVSSSSITYSIKQTCKYLDQRAVTNTGIRKWMSSMSPSTSAAPSSPLELPAAPPSNPLELPAAPPSSPLELPAAPPSNPLELPAAPPSSPLELPAPSKMMQSGRKLRSATRNKEHPVLQLPRPPSVCGSTGSSSLCSTTSTKKLRVKCKKLPQHNKHPIPLLPDTSSVSVSAGSSPLLPSTSDPPARVKCNKHPQLKEHPVTPLSDTPSISVSAGSSSLISSTSDQTARVKFTQEEKEAVQKLFESWIEKGDMPRIGVVRDIVKQNKKLARCLSNRSFLQVRDRVRNAIKAQTKSTSM
ncbi:uncharacterized protein LOC105442748 isoform X2 [Strongylocentrotus purpuratus]|uniref:Neurofilament medium polypeptide n=1 Tax=Strongylocentrotus purpuratus TaxID=7668 RepID=A0A7M7N3Z6_STRPU|nr:uncharacterized protein LOC105442748 isoform X2 [Strongylocentrotus purpuratus]